MIANFKNKGRKTLTIEWVPFKISMYRTGVYKLHIFTREEYKLIRPLGVKSRMIENIVLQNITTSNFKSTWYVINKG